MPKRTKKDSLESTLGCCRVESLVAVDGRGQMVLPKRVREMANIHAGDQLALVSWQCEGKLCCLALIRAEKLADMVQGLIAPLMKGVLNK